MATVTLPQYTNMADEYYLPTSIYSIEELGYNGVNSSPGDEFWLDDNDGYLGPGEGARPSGYHVAALGTFTLSGQNTITEVQIDTYDKGNFVNLDITGLSFTYSQDYFFAVIRVGNMAQFVSDLLSGDDTITGSSGNDTILGFSGNDTLIGGAGGDVLNGGVGSDTVTYATAPAGLFAGLADANANTGAAAGDSYIAVENLIGSAFNDVLYGSSRTGTFNHGRNSLSGGAGNDVLVGKGNGDRLDGGIGSDTVAYDASFPYTGNFAIGADLLSPASNTGDALGDVYISIENLTGSSFDDLLAGNNSANILRGNLVPALQSGKDQLFGRGGNDQLLGFGDADRLDGGLGRDVMAGGTGADVFVFNSALDSGNAATTRDRITDFTHLTDDINLYNIDANGAAVGHTFLFLATMGAAFTGVKGQLRLFQENPLGTINDKTIIAGDIDGNKVSDFMIELTGLKVLTSADFVL